MGTPKLIILLCCTTICLASHESHVIPVEGYETEVHDLGEQVFTPETPVKVIKITKTIAVKVPVPYPVKVIQKVPYPVHISKPYPVPVPHIVRIPQPVLPKGHHEQGSDAANTQDGHSYNVHENHEGPNQKEYEPLSENESFTGGHYNNNNDENSHFGNEYPSHGIPSQAYGAPNGLYGGYGGQDESNSFESRSYDEAIQKYLDGNHPQGQNEVPSEHY